MSYGVLVNYSKCVSTSRLSDDYRSILTECVTCHMVLLAAHPYYKSYIQILFEPSSDAYVETAAVLVAMTRDFACVTEWPEL